MPKSKLSCRKEDCFNRQVTSATQCECHAPPSCSFMHTKLDLGSHLRTHIAMPVSVTLNEKPLSSAEKYKINANGKINNRIRIVIKKRSSDLSGQVESENPIAAIQPEKTRREAKSSMKDRVAPGTTPRSSRSMIRIYGRPSMAYTALIGSQHSSMYNKYSKKIRSTKRLDPDKQMAVTLDPHNLCASPIRFQEPLHWNSSEDTTARSSSHQIVKKRKRQSRTIPLGIGQRVCSSMQFDVSQVKTTLRNKIEHPNRKVAEQLRQLGSDKILMASRPAKCCRQVVLNEESDPAMPYAASLKSIPLSVEDVAVIEKSLKYTNNVKNEAKVRSCKEDLSYYVELGQEDALRWANNAYKNQEKKLYRVEKTSKSAPKKISDKWTSFYNLLSKLDTEESLFNTIYESDERSLNQIIDKQGTCKSTDSLKKVRYSTSSMSISVKIRMKKEEKGQQKRSVKKNAEYVTESRRVSSRGILIEKQESSHSCRKVVRHRENRRLRYCLNLINKKDESKKKPLLWSLPQFYGMFLNNYKDRVPKGMRLCGGKDALKKPHDDFVCIYCRDPEKRQQQLAKCECGSHAVYPQGKFNGHPNNNEISVLTCTTDTDCTLNGQDQLETSGNQTPLPDHLETSMLQDSSSREGEAKSNESSDNKLNLCWPGPQITLTLTAVKGTLVNAASKEKMCLVSLKQSTPTGVDSRKSQTCGSSESVGSTKKSTPVSSITCQTKRSVETGRVARQGKCEYWPNNCESRRTTVRCDRDQALKTERTPQTSEPKRKDTTQTFRCESRCDPSCQARSEKESKAKHRKPHEQKVNEKHLLAIKKSHPRSHHLEPGDYSHREANRTEGISRCHRMRCGVGNLNNFKLEKGSCEVEMDGNKYQSVLSFICNIWRTVIRSFVCFRLLCCISFTLVDT